MAAGTKRTTSHEEIRRRIEARGAGPPGSNGTGRGDDPGILRVDFPGRGGESRLSKLVRRTGD